SLDPVVPTHHEDGLGGRAGVLEDDRHHVRAGPHDRPSRPSELAILEITDGVRRVKPIALEEPAEDCPVVRRPCDDGLPVWPPGDRDAGHQPPTLAGVAVSASADCSARAECSASPGEGSAPPESSAPAESSASPTAPETAQVGGRRRARAVTAPWSAGPN